MPKGTFYVPYWLHSNKDCLEMITKFKINPQQFLDFTNLHIYGNNNWSASFSVDYEADDNNLFFYDANVVGDAAPIETLYIVFDDSLISEKVKLFSTQFLY